MFETPFVALANHLLLNADWARQRLRGHAGRTARIDAGRCSVGIAVAADGLFLRPPSEDAEPDLVLELPANALVKSPEGWNALMRTARMRGNVEFAETFGFVLRNLRWDLEEDLSRLTGDIAARRIVRGGEALRSAFADGLRRLGEAVAEYLVHEAAVAVREESVASFCRNAADLGGRLERLESRLQALESRSVGAHAGSVSP